MDASVFSFGFDIGESVDHFIARTCAGGIFCENGGE